jgi:predicted glycoside hydrolase/deacetylase ChbG (UPF0249 family)
MTSVRLLIVNADDFGLSDGVNEGVIQAHRHGIVTSASLMVRQPAARAAGILARESHELSVGIHLDLGEWKFENGQWVALYERVSLGDASALEREVDAQLAIFQEIMGRAPTHIDAHQHAHRNEPLLTIAKTRSAELGVPLRKFTPGFRYCGDFYGQDDEGKLYPERVTAEFLIALVGSFEDGVTELCVHPAARVDFEGAYGAERVAELAALCDPRVRVAVEAAEIELVSFPQAFEGQN